MAGRRDPGASFGVGENRAVVIGRQTFVRPISSKAAIPPAFDSPGTPCPQASFAIQDLKVNLYHNAGVVTGVYHTKGSYNGKPYDHLGRFTDTWIFNDGKWECVASHTSLLKK